MRNADLRRYTPVIVIVALVAAPLAIWAATSGGSDDQKKDGLLVERSVSVTGSPELVISIIGNAEVTNGSDSVQVECFDKEGNVLIKSPQPWPFIEEPGYPYAHVHQTEAVEKVEGSRRCRVLGTDKRLEAKVQ